MATNKRKDSAALFELIDKSTLKVPKQGGSLKIPSWWSSKSNPPSMSHSGGVAEVGRAGKNAAEPTAFQKPVPPPPTPASSASPQSVSQPRMFEPPADIAGAASPSIRPPVPPSGPRFAMVTAASKTEETEGTTGTDGAGGGDDAANQEAVAGEPAAGADENNSTTAVIEPQEGTEQVADQDAASAGLPENYAGLGAGRRIFAPQTMSQTDGIHRDWVSLQKARLARSPMWAMVAGVAAIIIFLALVVYTIMPHRPAATPDATATNSSVNNGTKTEVTSGGASLLHRPNHATPTPAGDHHSAPNPAPPQATQGRVYEPGTAPRSADLYYIKIATTSVESIARWDADFLAKHGVSVSIETQMSRTHRLLYILISVQGFPTMSDAHDLRTKIVDIGHLPPRFSAGHPAWDDAPVLRWSSLTRR